MSTRRDDVDPASMTSLRARRAGAQFSVSVRGDPAGRWTVLEIEGEMDLQAFPLVPDLVDKNAPRMVFDLSGVSLMDAGGLRALVEAQRRARNAGGYVRLVAPSRSAGRVLRLSACDRYFLTFDTVRDAVAAPIGADPQPAY
jgi:anti-anti-sigma factor